MWIFFGNYLLATFFSFFSQHISFQNVNYFDILLGIFTGFMFLNNFLIYEKNISVNGLSLSVGIMRVSLIIPIFLSTFLFKEYIGLTNYLGIAIIVFSFVLMTETRTFHNLFWIALLFVMTGITDSSLKIYDEYGSADKSVFIATIFTTALILIIGYLSFFRRKFNWISIGYGLLLGIPNQLTTKFFLKSLDFVPAPIAYPIYASGVVILTLLCDLFIWKRYFTYKQRIAFILIVVGITLLNIRH
jgi:uncharacterized membrane protein